MKKTLWQYLDDNTIKGISYLFRFLLLCMAWCFGQILGYGFYVGFRVSDFFCMAFVFGVAHIMDNITVEIIKTEQ